LLPLNKWEEGDVSANGRVGARNPIRDDVDDNCCDGADDAQPRQDVADDGSGWMEIEARHPTLG